MNKINFTHNWNNGKLNLDVFTTIRKADKFHVSERKRSVGNTIEIHYKNHLIAIAEIVSKEKMTLNEIEQNEILCYGDTGYDGKTTRGIIEKMYPLRENDNFYVLTLKVITRMAYVGRRAIGSEDLFA